MKQPELTEAERAFLASQGLNEDHVLIAPGLRRDQLKSIAKQRGMPVVLGTPCKKAGHRLRNRSGHCVQCDTSKLAYQRRYSRHGFVYIAGSLRERLIKVGGTEVIGDRIDRLRRGLYGGAVDWQVLLHVELDRYGEVEFSVHGALSKYRVVAPYLKDGQEQISREMYRCSFSVAEGKLRQAVAGLQLPATWSDRSVAAERYEF